MEQVSIKNRREVAKAYFERIKEKHREVCCYNNMVHRCYNEKHKQYKDYGARGIKIDERWLGKDGKANFMADMGPRPEGYTIDRIDNDGSYSPENCRWASRKEQARNRRTTSFVLYEGREISVAEAAELSGLSFTTLLLRLRRGEPNGVLFRPVQPKRQNKLH